MFLETTVVPFLEANKFRFLKSRDEILVPINADERFDIHIRESPSHPSSLHIVVSGIISFPKPDGYMPSLLTELNAMTLGKWLATESGEILYVFDVLPAKDFGQDSFKRYFDATLAATLSLKEPLMRVKYLHVTLKRALKYKPNPQKEKSKRDVERLIKEALEDTEEKDAS